MASLKLSGSLMDITANSRRASRQTGYGGSGWVTSQISVQHHWVTESGDTLTIDPAVATTDPVLQTLLAVLTYPLHISGSTGKFDDATGDVTSIVKVDLSKNATVFRYSGQVCFAE